MREGVRTVDHRRLRTTSTTVVLRKPRHESDGPPSFAQKELSKRVDMSESVLCRLEDADYDRHSMAMLRRIAAAAGHKVQVRFVPDTVRTMEHA